MFTGTGTALVTPFRRDVLLTNRSASFDQATDEAGVDFLVPVEQPARAPRSRTKSTFRVVKITVELAKVKAPVLGAQRL